MSTIGENFTDHELQSLKGSTCLLDVIRATFFFHSTDAFLALCSLVAHGKNCASPNKKIRKAARQELFSKIAYETFPIKNHANIKLSYFEVVTGLQSLSDRWLKYSYDELLSLVFVLDSANKGSLSSDEFEAFTELVEAALYKDPSKHVEAFTALYESMRASVVNRRDSHIHGPLRDKLTALANRARYLEQTPLTMMYSLSEEHNHHCPNTVFVGLLEEMVTFVKRHHLKVEKTSVVDVVTGPVVQMTHISPTSANASRRSSLNSSNSPGRTNNNNSFSFDANVGNISRLSSSDSAFDQSVNSFTTPVKGGGGGRRTSTTPAKESARRGSQKPTTTTTPTNNNNNNNSSSASLTKNSRRQSSSSSMSSSASKSLSPKAAATAVEVPSAITPEATVTTPISPDPTTISTTTAPVNDSVDPSKQDDISAHAPVKSNNDVGVNVDLDEAKKTMVADKLKEFKSKEVEISGNLNALDKQLVESQANWDNLQQVQQEKQSNSPSGAAATNRVRPVNPFSPPSKVAAPLPPTISAPPSTTAATVTTTTTTTSANIAAVPVAVSNGDEEVISVTPANIDRVLFTTPTNTNNTATITTTTTAGMGDVSMLEDTTGHSVISSIAPASVTNNSNYSGSGGSSAIVSKKAMQRIERVSSRGTMNSTAAGNGSRRQLVSPKVNNASSYTIGMNDSVRSLLSVASQKRVRDRSRYQEPPRTVNMNIFKTPLHRQKHPNQNQFDEKNGWIPTKVSNRYNERFQYISDLRIADKINSVFYNNINPR